MALDWGFRLTMTEQLRLSEPFKLGHLTLRNRVTMAPMERNYCDIEGHLTERYIAYLEARARGGVALVTTEASYVRADGKGRLRQMGVHEDEMIPGMKNLAKRIHGHGALLGVEINHGGRTAQARVSGLRPVAPSPVPCQVAGGDVPLELEEDEIQSLVASYADATRRCAEAGVDVVIIHAGHGYLIHQFMSPRTNLRSDTWASPTKFLDAVIEAVRRNAGSMLVTARISAFEGAADGLDADATYEILSQSRLDSVDLIDVSAGSYEGREWIVQPGELPQGLLRHHARRYQSLGRPVGVAGRINSVEVAEDIVLTGDADVVTMARALHADPDWTRKVFAGFNPRPCIACNLCIDLLGTGEPIPCTVNADVGLEYERRSLRTECDMVATVAAREPKEDLHARVTIVGAGPSGLEAARLLSDAGLQVTLFERESQIGGQFALASSLHEYPEYGRILNWYSRELERLSVNIRLNVEVDVAAVAATEPDAILIATGATGYRPSVPGIDLPHVADIRDWIRQGREVVDGVTYAIWGTDREAVAVADDIEHRGGRVLIFGATSELAADVGARAKILVLPRLYKSAKVDILLGVGLKEIRSSCVVLDMGGRVDSVSVEGPLLISQGVVSDTGLLAGCSQLVTRGNVRLVGDAAGNGGQVAECVAHGSAVARELITDLLQI